MVRRTSSSGSSPIDEVSVVSVSSGDSTIAFGDDPIEDCFIILERVILAAEFLLSVFEDAYIQSVEYVYHSLIPSIPLKFRWILPPERWFTNFFSRVVFPGIWFSMIVFAFTYHVFLVWNRACNIDFLTPENMFAQVSPDTEPVNHISSFLVLCVLLTFVTGIVILVDIVIGDPSAVVRD